MTKWILLVGAILCEVTGSLALKAALEQHAFYVLALAGFAAALSFLVAALRRGAPLGTSYGTWAASGVALTSALSARIYDERFSGVMVLGIGIIVLGVLLIGIGSRSGHLPHVDNTGRVE